MENLNTKITQTFVKQVKQHLKNKWHDQAWHDFHNQTEVGAVQYGIRKAKEELRLGDNQYIAEIANNYISDTLEIASSNRN